MRKITQPSLLAKEFAGTDAGTNMRSGILLHPHVALEEVPGEVAPVVFSRRASAANGPAA